MPDLMSPRVGFGDLEFELEGAEVHDGDEGSAFCDAGLLGLAEIGHHAVDG